MLPQGTCWWMKQSIFTTLQWFFSPLYGGLFSSLGSRLFLHSMVVHFLNSVVVPFSTPQWSILFTIVVPISTPWQCIFFTLQSSLSPLYGGPFSPLCSRPVPTLWQCIFFTLQWSLSPLHGGLFSSLCSPPFIHSMVVHFLNSSDLFLYSMLVHFLHSVAQLHHISIYMDFRTESGRADFVSLHSLNNATFPSLQE